MRLIDADALEREYRRQFESVYKHTRDTVLPSDFYIERKAAYDKELMRMEMEAFCEFLKSRPTIDAEPVVRCKDCKHWGTGYGGETEHIKVCEYANYMVSENGYCVYGERKMDEEER